MVVDEALDVDSLESYAPYGDPLEAGSFGSPFTFTGELLDANALLYLRARYYSPALGVFTALDPIENPNRYQYVSANPVSAVDPSGMIFEFPFQDDCYQASDGIRSGCKICWMIWEDIYQKKPDFGLYSDTYYLPLFEQCLEKYKCPRECYVYPYCREPNIIKDNGFEGYGEILIREWVKGHWDAYSHVCSDQDLAVDNIWTLIKALPSTPKSLWQGNGLLPGVETLGFLISGEGILQILGILGPAVGLGGMFVVNRNMSDCGVYTFDELGGAVSLDPILDTEGFFFSTSPLDQIPGGGVDFSFDFLFLSGGISISNGCQATVSIGISLPDLPSGTLTRPYTEGRTCSEMVEALFRWNDIFERLGVNLP
jgi:RHS repeat-associated protein